MADYTYQVLYIYDNGGSFNLIASDDSETATATDGDSDTTFEAGDTFTVTLEDSTNGDAPFDVTVTYEGFATFEGESVPIGSVDEAQFPPALVTASGLVGDGVFIVLDPRALGDITPPSTYDAANELTASPYTVCFGAGTQIATPGGTTAVEALAIGDEILTADGQSVPVKWIGRQTVSKMLMGPRTQPVRISKGALGAGLPSADLTVTGDHGMVVDGLVINASALVNGDSIDWVALSDLPQELTYYHVETENHDVILANDAPAETFVDYLGRRAFDNHAEYLALYGAERIIPEMSAPRVSSARLLPAELRKRFGIELNDKGLLQAG